MAISTIHGAPPAAPPGGKMVVVQPVRQVVANDTNSTENHVNEVSEVHKLVCMLCMHSSIKHYQTRTYCTLVTLCSHRDNAGVVLWFDLQIYVKTSA